MLVNGHFDDTKKVEKFEYEVEVQKGSKEIKLEILNAPFEHVIIEIEDSQGNYRALTSFKTFEKRYFITNDRATTSNCCVSGELPSGIWKIKILKNYLVKGEFSLEFTTNFEVTNREDNLKQITLDESFPNKKEWYCGELHNHTRVSDGKISLEELEKELVDKKLDFVFPTEHNSVLTKYPNIDIPVIPSTELTLDDLGHFNFFGLKEFIDYYSLIDENEKREDSLHKIFKVVKEQGGYISLNHPFHNSRKMPLGLMYDIELSNLDFLEVINSPTVSGRNPYYDKKALEALDILWINGYKIFAVAGSDNHDLTLGDPLNYIRLDKYSTKDILTNLKRGRTYISRVGEVEMRFENNGEIIYSGAEVNGEVKAHVEARQNLIWKVIKNNRVVETVVGKSISTTQNLEAGEYFRIEATDIEHEILVVINPIFNGIADITPKIKTWFEIKDKIWRE